MVNICLINISLNSERKKIRTFNVIFLKYDLESLIGFSFVHCFLFYVQSFYFSLALG